MVCPTRSDWLGAAVRWSARLPSGSVEVLSILAIFALVGAWPVPDVNEPYYLGKAIRFWNPDWARGDFFLETADAHKTFGFAFGWLSVWLGPAALAWTGRLATWGLLAWSWQRLSVALLPQRWFSVLTAALFVTAQERCHMAGEWLIGGVEAKGFAYALVFLGLEAAVRDRWNRAWLLFGGAASFHVLVGGWSVVAAGLAWLWLGKKRPPLRAQWRGLTAGLLLSLPGLIPSLLLTWGTDAQTVSRADVIHVFERLNHHLDPTQFRTDFLLRFAALVAFWGFLCWVAPRDARTRRLQGFVAGAVTVAAVGGAISTLKYSMPDVAAMLLRFYWFRLADVAVPTGVAFAVGSIVLWGMWGRRAMAACCLALSLLAVVPNLGWYAARRLSPGPPRAEKWVDAADWQGVCAWIAHSGTIPQQARFLTPKLAQTFKWHTGRAEVANWKENPQDARSIVEWRARLEGIFGSRTDEADTRWRQPLAAQDAARLRELGRKYGAEYLLTESTPRVVALERLYANDSYAVYRLIAP